MKATKYTGVKFHDAKDGTRTYYIQYKLNGKVKRQKVGSKAEGISPLYCEKLRTKIIVKNRLGEDAPAIGNHKIKTFGKVADEFFQRSDLKSKYKLQSLYNTHLLRFLDESLSYFDNETVQKFINLKLQEKSKKTKRVLSKQTVNSIITLLSAILNFAKQKNYIKSIHKIDRKLLKTDNVRTRFLTNKEIDELLTEIKTAPLIRNRERLLLFTRTALFTGGRLGSILNIRGKDINRQNRTVQLYNYKTGKTYTSFLPKSLLDKIPPLKPQEKMIDVTHHSQIQYPLLRILDKLFNVGLKPEDRNHRVVVHTLRHTFASHLAINGTPIHTIMKLMDHKKIEMTLRYAKLMPDSGRGDVENLYE